MIVAADNTTDRNGDADMGEDTGKGMGTDGDMSGDAGIGTDGGVSGGTGTGTGTDGATRGRVLFVTGTGTEVGKTVTTAAVTASALRAGLRVAVLKPGQTGVAPEEPGDADEVRRLAGPAAPAPDALTLRELARYPEPLAPDTAARRSGLPCLAPEDVAKEVAALAERHDLVLVEGAGGLLVRYDEQGRTLADQARAVRELGLPAEVLLVATAGLGTLNTTALTAEALAARGLPLLGVVVGAWPDSPGLADRCNLADLPRAAAGAPLLGALPERAGRAADFTALAVAALAPALHGSWDAAAFTAEHGAG
ncbi:dethiobiotin synthase [Kitasatospora purpeofusca]|uniref:dethiobiotin synthase n=1 Tax=Kitasatospora purpeofusca TaxID=67352 RepID=UPI0033F675D6